MSDTPAESERERIAAAIVELVGSKGYEQTSIEEIAERAGVSVAAFEGHFGDKEGCFLAVYEELRQEYLLLNAAAFAGGEGWRESLRATAYAAFDYFKADPARARFVALEVLSVGDQGAALLDATLDILVELVHAGRFELEDPDSVERTAAEAAVGSIWNMMASRIRKGELGEEKEVVPQLMFFAIMPYLGAEAAREELGMARHEEEDEA